MQRTLLHIALLLATATVLTAQAPAPAERPRFGVAGAFGLNLHTAGFTALPGTPSCCPEYAFGSGLAPALDLLFETPLSSRLFLSLRAGYAPSSGTLAADETTTVEQSGEDVPMTIEHTIDASLGDIGIGAMAGMKVGDRLRLMGGLRGGYVLSADFAQQERMADASTQGTFENGRRVRSEFAGEIPGASPISLALLAGVGYELPLNSEGTWLATPEIFLSAGLTPISGEVDWRAHAVRAGVALKYAPKSIPAEPDPPQIEPPTPPEPPRATIVADIEASGLDHDGVEGATVTLRVEEFIAAERKPLLGYIFFDEGSATIPHRYARADAAGSARFNLIDLAGGDPLAVPLNTLNIIGQRLRANPSATIRLVGTNAGVGEEENSTELSRRRAESVRDYLRDAWGIETRRMTLDARALPATPSNTTEAYGQEENRRVEISSTSPAILAPITLGDTIRTATPPTIRFRPHVDATAGIARWTITATQDGETLKKIEGEGAPPESIDWRIDLESETMPRAPGRMLYAMEIVDRAGNTQATTPAIIDVEQVTVQRKRLERVAEAEIERYGLILFDFDKAELRPEHRALLAEIAAGIDTASTVTVRGYTDRTGDPIRNRQLAEQRARAAADALGLPAGQVRVEAVDIPPYDNALPDGRFYSRTVVVEVKRVGDAG